MKLRKKYIAVPIIALILFISGCAEKTTNIIILHYNDFHGSVFPRKSPKSSEANTYIGGSTHIAGYINKVRRENKNVLYLNAGDELKGTPISDLTQGKALFDLLDIIKPDAFELGNHEFDYGLDNLRDYINNAKFPVLCSNIVYKGKGDFNVKPYVIKEYEGVRIGIIGIVTQSLKHITSPSKVKEIEIIESKKALFPIVAKLRGQVDILIVLSHEDIEVEKELAKSIPGIDIMITGHDHLELRSPLKVGKTLIAQAGSNGEFIGRINLYYDTSSKKIIHKKSSLIRTLNNKLPEDPTVKEKVKDLESLLGNEFFEQIGFLEVPWNHRYRNTESGMGNFEADVLKEFTNADIAFVNSGSIRKGLGTGPITLNDIWEMFPFDDEAFLYELKGKRVLDILEQNCINKSDMLQLSGLRMTFDSQSPPGKRILRVHIQGEDLDPEKIYKVTMLDYVAHHWDRYLGFDIKGIQHKNLGTFGKTEISNHIKRQQRIRTGIENRIVDIYRE